MKIHMAILAVMLAIGCGGGGGGGSTPAPPAIQAPTGLTYTINHVAYTSGEAINPNTPSSSGGAVTSYSVNPTLPTGLNLSTTTGIISGTPTAVVTGVYEVTARNSAGSCLAILTITVNAAVVAPSGLTYSANPAAYTYGVAISPNSPSSSGSAVSFYSVSPSLPTGLNFNNITGVITGTPTSIAAASNYTVTAENSGGSTTAILNITVRP